LSTADASASAAQAASESAPQLRSAVFALISKAADGMTCDEVEVALDLKHQTASARIRELALEESIEDSGRYRLTRSGCKAVVWVLPSVRWLRPPLKWAGGKTWLVPKLRELYAPHRHRRLVEPFMGAATVSLALDPERALLADSNLHLINFYVRLRDPRPFSLTMSHDEVVYYAYRDWFNALVKTDAGKFSSRAAELFYYLNRSCYNGLCRLNLSGEFNVPRGKYKTVNYRVDFSEYAAPLQRWALVVSQFSWLSLFSDDFVFVDPPYDSEFTSYDGTRFTWEDQVRVAERFAQHPGPVVATNQATERVISLYTGLGYKVDTAEAPRSISANGSRKTATEIVATRNL
jgi:DNA adenine methylase